MGYGTTQKGYRLFNIECMKVIHSRDVVFDETFMPGIQKETAVKYVELEIDEEPIVEYTMTNDHSANVPDETVAHKQLSEEPASTNPSSCKAVPRRSV